MIVNHLKKMITTCFLKMVPILKLVTIVSKNDYVMVKTIVIICKMISDPTKIMIDNKNDDVNIFFK